MSIYRTNAPAKLNIRLKVIGKRADGYHDLVSIMVPVDLCDQLELESGAKGIRTSCIGLDVPNDESNLVHQAAKAFFKKTGISEGISIRLIKRIPVSAGMGGGSSNAAAILFTLNDMWSGPLSFNELHEIGAGLGADVPFFLYGRPCLATGIGEILEPLENWPQFWYVIVKPPISISTAWVYGNLKSELTTKEYEYIKKWLKKHPLSIPPILENDLEKVSSSSFPIIGAIKEGLLRAGADGALMTGSGPSVFGLFPSLDQANSAKDYMVSQKVGEVFVAADWHRD